MQNLEVLASEMAELLQFQKKSVMSKIRTDRPTFRQTDRVTYTIRWSRIKSKVVIDQETFSFIELNLWS